MLLIDEHEHRLGPLPEPSGEGEQTSGELSTSELIAAAAAAYDDAIEAQKKGDWAGYGKYMDELEKYLNKLAK